MQTQGFLHEEKAGPLACRSLTQQLEYTVQLPAGAILMLGSAHEVPPCVTDKEAEWHLTLPGACSLWMTIPNVHNSVVHCSSLK